MREKKKAQGLIIVKCKDGLCYPVAPYFEEFGAGAKQTTPNHIIVLFKEDVYKYLDNDFEIEIKKEKLKRWSYIFPMNIGPKTRLNIKKRLSKYFEGKETIVEDLPNKLTFDHDWDVDDDVMLDSFYFAKYKRRWRFNTRDFDLCALGNLKGHHAYLTIDDPSKYFIDLMEE